MNIPEINNKTGRTLSRMEAIKLGAICVIHLDKVCNDTGKGCIDLAGTKISLPLVLCNFLATKFATELQKNENQKNRENALWQLYQDASTIKGCVFKLCKHFLNKFSTSIPNSPKGIKRIMIIMREDTHMKNLIMVANEMKERYGVEPYWLVFKKRHHRLIKSAGYTAFLVDCLRPAQIKKSLRLSEEMKLVISKLKATKPPVELNFEEWQRVLKLASEKINSMIDSIISAADDINRITGLIHPLLMLVGNPCTLEGRLGAAAGKSLGIPTACIQHGYISPGDPLWKGISIDLVCAWGQKSKDALISCGYAPGQVEVTGAPYMDISLSHKGEQNIKKRKTVLVALSGPGHMFGEDEHERIVRQIYIASSKLPGLRWIFRLHYKDGPASYRRTQASITGANGEIIMARDSKITVLDQLNEAGVLITAGSTMAVEAMFYGIPVITLGRADGEQIPDYITFGATTHIQDYELLEGCIKDIINFGQDKKTLELARKYADSFFYNTHEKATMCTAASLARFF